MGIVRVSEATSNSDTRPKIPCGQAYTSVLGPSAVRHEVVIRTKWRTRWNTSPRTRQLAWRNCSHWATVDALASQLQCSWLLATEYMRWADMVSCPPAE
jgi:hypothetical protein